MFSHSLEPCRGIHSYAPTTPQSVDSTSAVYLYAARFTIILIDKRDKLHFWRRYPNSGVAFFATFSKSKYESTNHKIILEKTKCSFLHAKRNKTQTDRETTRSILVRELTYRQPVCCPGRRQSPSCQSCADDQLRHHLE